MTEAGWKPGTRRKIETIAAWIAVEPDGGEGVIAVTMPNGLTLPLIGADEALIESFRQSAMEAHLRTGYPVRLVRFSLREVIEELPS